MTTRIRKSSETRKKEIIQAVLNIIGKQGINALATQTIADEVGLSSGALFRHFKNLEDLQRAVVKRSIELIAETFPDTSLDPLDRIFILANNRIKLLGANPGLAWLLRSEQAYLSFPHDSVNELRQMAKKTKKFMLKSLQDAAKTKQIRTDIEPDILIIPIMGSIHSLISMAGNSTTKQPNTKIVLKSLKRLISE